MVAIAKPKSHPACYEDLFDLPEHVVGEIIDGELVVSPRPAPPHATAYSVIGFEVGGRFHLRAGGPGGPGGWWIIDEPELHLGADVLVPDLAGWRRERMPVLPQTAWFELPPDWVCEIVSPHSGRRDRVQKLPKYAAAGVKFMWLVDPSQRMLESYRLQDEHWLLLGAWGGDVAEARIEPFDAVAINLARLWEGSPPETADPQP